MNRIVIAGLLLAAMAGASWAGSPMPKYEGKYEVLAGERNTHEPGSVKMTEFADFYCPHCHMFEQTVAIMMEKEFGNKVEITMVGFPVMHSKLPTAFEMYEQAKIMGKGTEMKKVLFRTIHKDKLHVLDRTIRELLIKEVGLDPAAFEAGLAGGRPAAAFEAGRKWGERVKIQYTPTVVLDGNIKVEGENLQPENLRTVIASILAADGKSKKGGKK
jgi:thiol:disulfide interchange protein DsbA